MIRHFSHASRFVWYSCVWGLALGLQARAQVKPAAAEAPEVTPAPASRPAPAVPQPVPRVTHPQVSTAGFQREYRAIPMDGSEAAGKIRAAVAKPVDPSLKFRGTSLRAAASLVQDAHCVPVVFDTQSLTDAGIDVDTCTIEQEAVGGCLGTALRFLLRPLNLTWTIADEALTVTTREKAEEMMAVFAYPAPRDCADNRPVDFHSLIDLIQSGVAAQKWDTVGGMGAIRPLDDAKLLVVSQTLEVHDEVEALLRAIHGRFLTEFADGRPVLRVHHVAGAAARASLAESLKALCNASLADGRDEQAAVSVIGDSVAVVSKSPEFHALAAQVVAAVDGVIERPGLQVGGGTGPPPQANFFCWVAREVYGANDPRWLVFRGWMTEEAPGWLREAYAACGPGVADWLRVRPAARAVLRRLMDAVVERRLADAGLAVGPALP